MFSPLQERFGFTVNAAASAANAKCPRFWTEADDGLAQSWAGERVWCNPPYSYPTFPVLGWRRHGRMEEVGPDLIVMLVPANRTEQQWWQEHIEPYRDLPDSDLHVEFLPSRMRFLAKTEVGPDQQPPFGCCLLIWEAREATISPRLGTRCGRPGPGSQSAEQVALFDLRDVRRTRHDHPRRPHRRRAGGRP